MESRSILSRITVASEVLLFPKTEATTGNYRELQGTSRWGRFGTGFLGPQPFPRKQKRTDWTDWTVSSHTPVTSSTRGRRILHSVLFIRDFLNYLTASINFRIIYCNRNCNITEIFTVINSYHHHHQQQQQQPTTMSTATATTTTTATQTIVLRPPARSRQWCAWWSCRAGCRSS